jgi:hypothetical protein
MTQILEQNNALKTTNATKINIGYVENLGISFSLPLPITKWWFSNTYFNLYNNHYVGDIPKTTIAADGSSTTVFEPFNARATSYTANMTHQFTLPRKYSVELSGWYLSPFIEGQLAGNPMGAISFGIQKKMMNDKASVKLNINDIFWTNVLMVLFSSMISTFSSETNGKVVWYVSIFHIVLEIVKLQEQDSEIQVWKTKKSGKKWR